MIKISRLLHKNRLVIDLFIIINLSFLSVDIFFAHSVNDFSKKNEFLPLYFSLISSFFLGLELLINLKKQQNNRLVSIIIGCSSIIIGIMGVYYHLHNSFFKLFTLKSLVYTAPFIAPLAYTGLGLLIIINSKVPPNSTKWSKGLILLGLGGFIGNYILSVCDHAQNGFFIFYEWIPVISSSIAVGFLSIVLIKKHSMKLINISILVMIIQIFIGLLGFYFHISAILSSDISDIFEKIIYNAPIFAPLLFVNLGLLSIIGLLDFKLKIN